MWKGVIGVVFLGGFIAAAVYFGGDGTVENFAYEPSLDTGLEAPLPTVSPPAGISVDDREFICRAAIAEQTGHSLDIISATTLDAGYVRTEYTKPEDGSIWRSACLLDRDRVIQAYVFEDDSLGNWGVTEADPVVTFALEGDTVTISQSIGGADPMSGTQSRASD